MLLTICRLTPPTVDLLIRQDIIIMHCQSAYLNKYTYDGQSVG